MKRTRVATAGAIAGIVALAAPLRADTPPSAWDRAADPSAAQRWALHVRVDRLLHPPPPEDPGDTSEIELRRDDELRLEAARGLLEEADAAHSSDVRLRFDLGMIYEQLATLDKRNDLQLKAVDVLAPAVDAAPDHPAVTEALEALVYAYAKLDRPRDELATWRRYIPRLTEDRARVAPLMNMGEAEMRLGMLDEAMATFREGLALCESLPNTSGVNETYALTLWDIAVTLDRSGDPAGALATAAKARGWSWVQVVGWGSIQSARNVTGWDIIRDESTVFFVPDWERDWYLALGFGAAATQADDAREAVRYWRGAEQHWASYIAQAEAAAGPSGAIQAGRLADRPRPLVPVAPVAPVAPGTRSSGAAPDGGVRFDRWLPLARARLESARVARAEAEVRAARLPKRPARRATGRPDE